MNAREEYEIEQAVSCLEDMAKRLIPSAEGGCASAALNAINILRNQLPDPSDDSVIRNIEQLYPPDSEFETTNDLGRAIMVAAILKHMNWRDLPERVSPTNSQPSSPRNSRKRQKGACGTATINIKNGLE